MRFGGRMLISEWRSNNFCRPFEQEAGLPWPKRLSHSLRPEEQSRAAQLPTFLEARRSPGLRVI
jgi:hypothetical protein